MEARGWDQCDFVFVSGDAYVDHPSFACAIITRVLESHGYKVGVIAQPDWRDPASVTVLGEPRLAFLVCSGNMDSMVNHYTVAKHRRPKDFYSPGGKMGLRPDHADVVYGNLIRRTCKHVPIVLGGIEGITAPPCPLRLLVGFAQAFDTSGLRRRHHLLRHGRALHHRDRRRPRRRRGCPRHQLDCRHGLPCENHRAVR